MRRSLAYGGEMVDLARRGRATRPQVLLCDVSGSMERYTRMLLHFFHTFAAAPPPAEPPNRTAWPALQSNQPCGRCGASPMMRRQYYYRRITVRTCLNCGWDGYRRAGEGMPDHCRKSESPFVPPCEEL